MRRKNGDSPISLFSFQDAMTGVCGVVVLITLILALELTRRVENEATATVSQSQIDVAQARVRELQTELEAKTRELDEQTVINAEIAGTSPEAARLELESTEANLLKAREENKRTKADLAQNPNEEDAFRQLLEEISSSTSNLETLETELKAARNYSVSSSNAYYQFPENVRETPWFFEISDGKIQGTTRGERTKTFVGASCVGSFVDWAKTRDRSEEYFVLIFRPSGAGYYSKLIVLLQLLKYRYGVDLIGEEDVVRFVEEERDEEE